MNTNFSPRVREFVKLRYGEELGFKDIAAKMGVSYGMVRNWSKQVYAMIGVFNNYVNEAPLDIKATKLLVKLGVITLFLLLCVSCSQLHGQTAAPLTITTTSCPGGTVGVAYQCQLTASGGTPPYAWSISAGALPPGLSLDATTGLISGVPIVPASPTEGSLIEVKKEEKHETIRKHIVLARSSRSSSDGVSACRRDGADTALDHCGVDLHARH